MAYTTINKGSSYFNTVTYTGTGATNTLTGVGFKPDFTWIKDRSNARDHQLVNAVVGYPSGTLFSNATDAEYTAFPRVDSSNADGFTVSTPTQVNGSGETYAAWNWLANNTSGSSNTAGSITSTVAANTTAGFSIVTYTGVGGASTVGHGLGVIPRMIILKGRSNARIWVIGHGSLGWTKYMSFDAAPVETNNYWNDTTPTSSVFSVFSSVNVNGSGETYLAYCFAEIKGYSKFGSYTGNGSTTNGPFIYTGFKPAFVMIKSSTVSGISRWIMKDNKRNTNNIVANNLIADGAFVENTDSNDYVDFLSNGFRITADSVSANTNNSGETYIYMAFAENPFVTSGGIPVTAR